MIGTWMIGTNGSINFKSLAATKQDPFSQDSFEPVVENPLNRLTFEPVTSLEDKKDDDGRSLDEEDRRASQERLNSF